jgi:hypothetical protein
MVLVSREQILSENQASLSATVGRFSHRAGYVLLLDRVVILACPTDRAVLRCCFHNIYKQTATHERPRSKTNLPISILSSRGNSGRILIKFNTG